MDKKEVVAILDKNPGAVAFALLEVYANQEIDEQAADITIHDNGKGFNGADSNFLSSVARQVYWKKYTLGKKWKDCLTEGQLKPVRQAIKKYWRQYEASFEQINDRPRK